MKKGWMVVGLLLGLWAASCVFSPAVRAHLAQAGTPAGVAAMGLPQPAPAFQVARQPGCVEELVVEQFGLEEHRDRVFQHARQRIQKLRRRGPVHDAVIGGKG